MRRCAFYITVDDNYLGIGLAQARRIHDLWDIDVHLFVEGTGGITRDTIGERGVFVHHNLMHDLIPDNLPSTKSWPRIVYGRIFAPRLLPDYDRLIYIDADIYPVHGAREILNIDLPGGLAAVQDSASLGFSPHGNALSRNDWLRSIGLETPRYFNAGVLMLDQSVWSSIDFASGLSTYMQSYSAVAKMQDQDYLNYQFQGIWTELSPRFNYQKGHFNYGYESVFPPVFVHFSSFQKPWLKPDASDSVQGQFYPIYERMFRAVGVDPAQYRQKTQENILRRGRTAIRSYLSQNGIVTSKERRQRAEWDLRAAAMYAALQEDGQLGRYADFDFSLSEMPRPQLGFDGRYLRRSLAIDLA
ncbi:glycosyltransferase family 8 protein [Paenirhodobacter enshiensis]|uniref:glycosyltransferase family 8 protein n=1 Tax=Paenirhodobacter enshiensis TaxID=1105367 RepID=UPI0035B1CAB6